MASVAPEAARDGSHVGNATLVRTPSPCRNCGELAGGNYCAACGQETTLALPTARQFLREAAGRYVALDGRLWRTLAALSFRPGYLTRAYFEGRRRRHIRPARLFLVLSLLMFAVLRVAIDVPQVVDETSPAAGAPAASNAASPRPRGPRVELPGFSVGFGEDAKLSIDRASGPFGDDIRRRVERFNAMSRQDKIEQLYDGIIRYGPYASFVLLPAFALLLRIAYLGGRRRHPGRPHLYSQHLVYAAHIHAFFFLIAAITVLLPLPGLGWLLFVWAAIYALRSLKSVYGGGWLGVVARAWLVGVAYFVLFVFVTVGLVLAAVFVR